MSTASSSTPLNGLPIPPITGGHAAPSYTETASSSTPLNGLPIPSITGGHAAPSYAEAAPVRSDTSTYSRLTGGNVTVTQEAARAGGLGTSKLMMIGFLALAAFAIWKTSKAAGA